MKPCFLAFCSVRKLEVTLNLVVLQLDKGTPKHLLLSQIPQVLFCLNVFFVFLFTVDMQYYISSRYATQ